MSKVTVHISVSIAGMRTELSPEAAKHIADCIDAGRSKLEAEDHIDYRTAQVWALFENAAKDALEAQARHQ